MDSVHIRANSSTHKKATHKEQSNHTHKTFKKIKTTNTSHHIATKRNIFIVSKKKSFSTYKELKRIVVVVPALIASS